MNKQEYENYYALRDEEYRQRQIKKARESLTISKKGIVVNYRKECWRCVHRVAVTTPIRKLFKHYTCAKGMFDKIPYNAEDMPCFERANIEIHKTYRDSLRQIRAEGIRISRKDFIAICKQLQR